MSNFSKGAQLTVMWETPEAYVAALMKCMLAYIRDLTLHHFITPRSWHPAVAGTPLILLLPPRHSAALRKCY